MPFFICGFLHFMLGKNAYALSVLRRVEMKIDGRDISESRSVGYFRNHKIFYWIVLLMLGLLWISEKLILQSK